MDLQPPITFAFPANTHAKNYPENISLFVNDPKAKTFYTIRSDTHVSDFDLYARPIIIEEETSIRYFSEDENKNLEQPFIEEYTKESSIPNIELLKPDRFFVNETGHIEFSFKTDVEGIYSVELGGDGTKGLGIELSNGSTQKDTLISLVLEGSNLENGRNKIFIHVENAYTSFYIYRDDNPPYPIVSPEEGLFNYTPEIHISTLEPSSIFYSLNTAGEIPLDPIENPAVYNDKIILSGTEGDFVHNNLKVQAVDLAGNRSTVLSVTYIIDRELPMLTILPLDTSHPICMGMEIFHPLILFLNPQKPYIEKLN